MSGSFESSHHHNHLQQQDSLKRRSNSLLQMKFTPPSTTTTTTTDDHHIHQHQPMMTNSNINPSPGFYARLVGSATHHNHPSMYLSSSTHRNLHNFQAGIIGDNIDEDLSTRVVIPQVTVVLEGRSICQRISLDKHASYHSLAKALRQMFVDVEDNNHHHLSLVDSTSNKEEQQLDLSNAIPGHLIAYEDMEDDLLLAGDLNWKDFVRVAKRIRIIPVKANSRKGRAGT